MTNVKNQGYEESCVITQHSQRKIINNHMIDPIHKAHVHADKLKRTQMLMVGLCNNFPIKKEIMQDPSTSLPKINHLCIAHKDQNNPRQNHMQNQTQKHSWEVLKTLIPLVVLVA